MQHATLTAYVAYETTPSTFTQQSQLSTQLPAAAVAGGGGLISPLFLLLMFLCICTLCISSLRQTHGRTHD